MRWISPALVLAAVVADVIGVGVHDERALFWVLSLAGLAVVVQLGLMVTRRATLSRTAAVIAIALLVAAGAWERWGFHGFSDDSTFQPSFPEGNPRGD